MDVNNQSKIIMKKKYEPVYKVKNNKVMKKDHPPLSPLAQQIKKILDQNVDDWHDERKVKGLTISAVKIETLFRKILSKQFANPAIISEIFG